MSRPEQATTDPGGRDEGAEPAGTEPRDGATRDPPADVGPDPWEAYDLAILDGVLDA